MCVIFRQSFHCSGAGVIVVPRARYELPYSHFSFSLTYSMDFCNIDVLSRIYDERKVCISVATCHIFPCANAKTRKVPSVHG